MEKLPDLKGRFLNLKTLASFLLAFGIIYLLFAKMDSAKVFEIIKKTNCFLYVLGFLVYYTTFPLRGLRFGTILKNNGFDSSVSGLTGIVLISWFANCIAPAKIGDVFRAYLVKKRYGHSFTVTVGAVFAERVFDLFILYLLIGGSGLIAFRGKIPPTMMTVLETGFVLLGLILAVLVLIKYSGNWIIKILPQKIRNMYLKFVSGTMTSFNHNWMIAGLTAIIWMLEGISFYMVAKAIGINLSFMAIIFTGLISALLTALPVTPAGLGIVEAAKVGVLIFFGVDRSMAMSAALLDRFINYWSLIIIGFIVYIFTVRKLGAKEAGTDEGTGDYSHLQ
jgi:uncharacterized protein (TIRG00374 family)